MNQLLTADERIRETSHRVRNSLQLVASMLSAQARQSRDAALVEGLRDAIGRIVAVAHLHENLQNETGQTVQLDEYLQDVCNGLALTTGSSTGPGGVHLLAERIRLPGPDALAVGLIVNELITNALKHAYRDGRGVVEVSLARERGRVLVTVADQGIGRFGACEGLGLTFVRLLAQRLHGEIEISDADPGTTVRVAFAATTSLN